MTAISPARASAMRSCADFVDVVDVTTLFGSGIRLDSCGNNPQCLRGCTVLSTDLFTESREESTGIQTQRIYLVSHGGRGTIFPIREHHGTYPIGFAVACENVLGPGPQREPGYL